MPLREDIDVYFAREVLPHVPEAWIDYSKTKVGYEIPFNRYFYVFKPPRALDEIGADLIGVTDGIVETIEDMTDGIVEMIGGVLMGDHAIHVGAKDFLPVRIWGQNMRYDSNKHHRRSIRLKGFDYTREGAYFVTICTQIRRVCSAKL